MAQEWVPQWLCSDCSTVGTHGHIKVLGVVVDEASWRVLEPPHYYSEFCFAIGVLKHKTDVSNINAKWVPIANLSSLQQRGGSQMGYKPPGPSVPHRYFYMPLGPCSSWIAPVLPGHTHPSQSLPTHTSGLQTPGKFDCWFSLLLSGPVRWWQAVLLVMLPENASVSFVLLDF